MKKQDVQETLALIEWIRKHGREPMNYGDREEKEFHEHLDKLRAMLSLI